MKNYLSILIVLTLGTVTILSTNSNILNNNVSIKKYYNNEITNQINYYWHDSYDGSASAYNDSSDTHLLLNYLYLLKYSFCSYVCLI